GPEGNAPLDRDTVVEKFTALAADIGMTPEAVAEGLLNVAVENMARAIKKISVERGHDITHHCLVAFGGAAAQHACRVAERLGISSILLHPLAGVLSAYGIGLAEVRTILETAMEAPLDDAADLQASLKALTAEARAALRAQGVEDAAIHIAATVRLRIKGTDTALAVPFADAAAMRRAFHDAYNRHFGFMETGKPLIVEAIA